ncbi:MAG TPA: hypothetical protein PLX89_06355 [Verrucomicrobiota bacterium]|nr:hypothetical protein [Verrucomicrobiales bacterium]HRI12612.1 hypothetical protein [Verrucomicrobiota bacterium]
MNDQDPEILALLAQMNLWWENNPYYIVQMDTKGQFMDSLTTMYYYMDGTGRRFYRGETWTKIPFEAHFIFQNLDNVTYALFPETGDYVANGAVIVYESFIEASLGDLTQANVLLKAAKERSLENVGGQMELVLLLDPKKLGVGPANADISLAIRYDNRPRTTSFDQLRMGLKQTTTFNYITTNQNQVLTALPQLPPIEQVSQTLNFDEALKRSILYFRNLKGIEV